MVTRKLIVKWILYDYKIKGKVQSIGGQTVHLLRLLILDICQILVTRHVD